ncbi:MAG: diguanylate cyclase [Gammaproteobacteria bacterium]|nr:diguanylate cyclase [Rhodocyclaceae bacterium]MBU3910621.1 diguanylate cyclase [Gammaproteobacteria bacterium]MBU3988314.1 diguanylate cyclase [Gammaproteobacteria bacterium]MBU4005102.1 diguanylate cyclase [Gammaproteobacteria bacterium]MBU4020695.1 diguanylate cyclase [Gammaproteobacteria bacterium]
MSDQHLAELSLEFNRHIVNLLDSLSALTELAQLSIHDMDEASLLKQALAALMANQDMERCSIYLPDPDGNPQCIAGLDWDEMLRDVTGKNAPVATPQSADKQSGCGDGIMGKASKSATLVHYSSCQNEPGFGKDCAGVDGALLCVPIICEGQVLGLLNVFHPQPGFFNMWHERLVLLFCQSLGRLLANHRLTHHLHNLVEAKTAKITRQQSFLRAVLDSVPDPVMVIGIDYRILMANRAAHTNASDLSGDARCHQISHHLDTPCDGNEHPCPLQRVLAGEEVVSVVHSHFDANGILKLVELTASPLRDETGATVGIVESTRDITERMLAEEKIRQLAYYDTLTDLPNRRLLQDRISLALAQAKRHHRSMAIMFLDLDRFKQINDTLGHAIGDELLKQIAQRLVSCVRQGDTVARTGGDEFIVVLTEITHPDDAARVAQKILAACAKPVDVAGQALSVTISIGIALHPVDSSDELDELMRKADVAMYRTKETGRNGYRFFEATP